MTALCRTVAGILLITGTLALGLEQFRFAMSAAALAIAWLMASVVAYAVERRSHPDEQ